ncbi:hypothetical protein IAD21_04253 [Abditibacteriota bacterium]|nr:hypothetical protein IAD21_04253 [Abditibacteriota bacterium]
MDDLKRTIWGVDFSGARLAGEKIWLARALADGDTLHIEQLLRADELPDSTIEREQALSAVVRTLNADTNAIAGLDFPFSLQTEALGTSDYPDFLKQSADYTDADAFKAAFSDARRRTDREGKTPFSPLNYRLYRQTYYGIRDVLRPLVENGAQVLPMMSPQRNALWLIEICPASTLKKEGLYLSYKGKSDLQRTNREKILRAIQSRFGVKTEPAMDERALSDTEGDALDAILAALGTLRGLQNPEALKPRDAIDSLEGRVYF